MPDYGRCFLLSSDSLPLPPESDDPTPNRISGLFYTENVPRVGGTISLQFSNAAGGVFRVSSRRFHLRTKYLLIVLFLLISGAEAFAIFRTGTRNFAKLINVDNLEVGTWKAR